MKVFLVLVAFIGSASSIYIPFWDEFAKKDYGLKVIGVKFEPCNSYPCVLHRGDIRYMTRFEFLAQGNYNIQSNALHVECVNLGTGALVTATYQLMTYMGIGSNDADNRISTLNKGGIYTFMDNGYKEEILENGRYQIRMLIYDGPNCTKKITDFNYYYTVQFAD